MTEYIRTEAACPVCHGFGKGPHAACDGNGFKGMGDTCRGCQGTGIAVCRECRGKGTVLRVERAGW